MSPLSITVTVGAIGGVALIAAACCCWLRRRRLALAASPSLPHADWPPLVPPSRASTLQSSPTYPQTQRPLRPARPAHFVAEDMDSALAAAITASLVQTASHGPELVTGSVVEHYSEGIADHSEQQVHRHSQGIPVPTALAAHHAAHMTEAEAMEEAARARAIAASLHSLALDKHVGPDDVDCHIDVASPHPPPPPLPPPPPPGEDTDATSSRAIEISVTETAEHRHAQTHPREQSPDYVDIAV